MVSYNFIAKTIDIDEKYDFLVFMLLLKVFDHFLLKKKKKSNFHYFLMFSFVVFKKNQKHSKHEIISNTDFPFRVDYFERINRDLNEHTVGLNEHMVCLND